MTPATAYQLLLVRGSGFTLFRTFYGDVAMRSRERWKTLLPIIQAHVDGKEIEHRPFPGGEWAVYRSGDFGGTPSSYRIQPEQKYRPFGNAAEFAPYRDRWLQCRTNPHNVHCRPQSFNDVQIGLSDGRVRTYIGLLNEYMFEDGSPCGVVVKPDQQS